MQLTPLQTILTILAITAGTMITRFAPFILFPEHKEPPRIISYLGKVLPPAMMGLLVIYCLRNVSLTASPHAVPEIISIAIIVLLHRFKSNVLLSIGAGTAVYMILIQYIFL